VVVIVLLVVVVVAIVVAVAVAVVVVASVSVVAVVVVAVVVVVVVAVAVAVLVVYHFVPLGTKSIFEAASPSYPQHRDLTACFAAFTCFLKNGSFPGLLRSASSSGSPRIPIQCFFFQWIRTPSLSV
jgi:hypothetical protein